ncbi:Retrovirus-related Pol polyprotein from transposon RE1-like protein [Drosera capensis]
MLTKKRGEDHKEKKRGKRDNTKKEKGLQNGQSLKGKGHQAIELRRAALRRNKKTPQNIRGTASQAQQRNNIISAAEAEESLHRRTKAIAESSKGSMQRSRLDKALYGLKQAPRAWYETLSNFFLENNFHRGKVDTTLFLKKHKEHILLVQTYIDHIIFGC